MASSSSISNREGTGLILAHAGVVFRHLYELYAYAHVALMSVVVLSRAWGRPLTQAAVTGL
ncbi:hypothetical protein GCM10022233_51090 [Streptomyces shaanxiensis]|uniref:MFS transporter n=1 Tax=Streptomyces shaanxiensis TaxID=653357 RepID=A0ABP7VJX9_9ACTN